MKNKIIPYVPGCVFGKLIFNWRSEASLRGKVIVIQNYNLADIMSLSSSKPEGVIVVGTERFSHLLIYLFSLGIPTVLIENSPEAIEDELILIDGTNGYIEISDSELPPSDWLTNCQKLQQSKKFFYKRQNEFLTTSDGVKICLGASISNIEGAVLAKENSSLEISLVRSEFLWTGTGVPKKEHLLKQLQKICQAASPLNVTIRLFDVGGDKAFDWIQSNSDIKASLGLRGCRSYQHPLVAQVITEELQAIAELSKYFKLGILVPYVTNINEFKSIKHHIESIVGETTSIGAVLETPAACMSINGFLDMTDNVFLGTNDILECFYGSNRTLKSVAHYLNPYSPELLRFLSHTAEIAGSKIDKVGICGQLPLFPHVIKILIGLGYRRFSIEPMMMPVLEEIVSQQSFQEMQKQAKNALSCIHSEEIFSLYNR